MGSIRDSAFQRYQYSAQCHKSKKARIQSDETESHSGILTKQQQEQQQQMLHNIVSPHQESSILSRKATMEKKYANSHGERILPPTIQNPQFELPSTGAESNTICNAQSMWRPQQMSLNRNRNQGNQYSSSDNMNNSGCQIQTQTQRQAMETSRTSPSSEFLTIDSSCKRSDHAVRLLVPKVTESFSTRPPYSTSVYNSSTCPNGPHYSHKHNIDSNMQMQSHPNSRNAMDLQGNPHSANRVRHFNPVASHMPEHDGIHDEARGAFQSKHPSDPNDREVENILAYNHYCPWQGQWQPTQSQDHQPTYHPPQQYHPHHEVYHAYRLQSQPPYPYYYPSHGYASYQHPHYYYEMNMQNYHPYNHMYSPPPYHSTQSKKRKSSSPSRLDYFIYVNRPDSPMSDITASPVPSFDETDERIHKPEPVILHQEQHKELLHKRVRCASQEEELAPSTARKKLTIDTKTSDFNPYIKKEPRIDRACEKLVSTFDWEENDVVLRTVSPLKPKEKSCERSEDENRLSCEETRSKIWRKKSEGVTRIIAKNVSNTFSEQGDFQYS